MRNIKGITLVALVVTIIILLILAGISIATLTGSGLFEKARLAEQESKNAQEREEAEIAKYINEIDNQINSSRNNNNWSNLYKGSIADCKDIDITNYKNIRIAFLSKDTNYQFREWKYFDTEMLGAIPTESDKTAFGIEAMSGAEVYLVIYFKMENNKISYNSVSNKHWTIEKFDLIIQGI